MYFSKVEVIYWNVEEGRETKAYNKSMGKDSVASYRGSFPDYCHSEGSSLPSVDILGYELLSSKAHIPTCIGKYLFTWF